MIGNRVEYLFAFVIFFSSTNFVLSYTVRDAPLLTKRPPWLLACRRNGPDLNKCLNDLFAYMFPYLAVGIPEIKVDQFEPLTLDKVSITKGQGAITLTGSLYDMTVIGPSNSTPSNTEFSIKDKHWDFDLDLPLLDIRSMYNLKGNILVLPLLGHGKCELKLNKIHTRVTTNITFPLREGREIIKIESMNVRFTIGKMRVQFYNLFNGNKILGQTVNGFINQNAIEIVTELEESLGQSLAGIFTELMNNVFTKIPTDLWLLTDEQFEAYLNEQKDKKE